MAKAARKKASPYDRLSGETHLAWTLRVARMKADTRDRAEPIVAAEAANHGDYEIGFVTHVETNTKAHTARNQATDTIARWRKKGRLTAAQIAAIDYCVRLWRLAGITQRVTASYGERIHGLGGFSETRCLNEIEARQDLHRIQGYIPRVYWDIFENIARHAMPLGETAMTAGYTGPGAEIRAHTVVCFVADIIAMRERL